jgi:hypothetical protein
MAGIICADTLQDGAGNSTAMDNAIYGSAKAWANWNGSSGSIRSSYNVSSVTRISTGQYTVSFTNALSNANYSVAGAAYNNNAGGESLRINTAPTASSVQVLTSSSGNAFDSTYSTVVIFGN